MDDLQQLGLTEYEAKAYVALLTSPGATGYEVSRRSGIPRAKIYEVLGSLQAKNIVFTSEDGDRTLHHPLPHETLLRRHVQRATQIAERLASELGQIVGPDEAAPLMTVRAYSRVIEKAREVIASAQKRVYVSGWPSEIAELATSLGTAERAGRRLFVLSYGPVTLPIERVFTHGPIGTANRAGMSPWLIVVADHSEALIAEPAPGDLAVALWTRNRGVAIVAAEYIKHDIFLNEAAAELAARGLDLGPDLGHLQAMWFDSDDPDMNGGGER